MVLEPRRPPSVKGCLQDGSKFIGLDRKGGQSQKKTPTQNFENSCEITHIMQN
jgi:hypothetical protein